MAIENQTARKQQLINSIQALREQAAITGANVPDKRIQRYQIVLAKLNRKPPISLNEFKQKMSNSFNEFANSLPD